MGCFWGDLLLSIHRWDQRGQCIHVRAYASVLTPSILSQLSLEETAVLVQILEAYTIFRFDLITFSLFDGKDTVAMLSEKAAAEAGILPSGNNINLGASERGSSNEKIEI